MAPERDFDKDAQRVTLRSRFGNRLVSKLGLSHDSDLICGLIFDLVSDLTSDFIYDLNSDLISDLKADLNSDLIYDLTCGLDFDLIFMFV